MKPESSPNPRAPQPGAGPVLGPAGGAAGRTVPRFLPRQRLVDRMRQRLAAQSWPRLQMALIVAGAALVGLVASAVLWRVGVVSMAWRYPLATLVGYAALLGLIGLWLRTRADDWADATGDGADLALDAWDAAHSADGPGLGSAADGADAGELALLLMVGLAVLALCAALLVVVAQAPVLLAEVALDGAVAGSLYHRLREGERRHWVASVWERTRWPLVGLLVLLAVAGAGVQHLAPEAVTLGQALALWRGH